MKTLFCAIAAAAASTYCTAEIFLADPTILLDSGTYYLTGTNDLEDAKAPFKIYHSKDLKNWSDKDSEGNEILAPDTKNSCRNGCLPPRQELIAGLCREHAGKCPTIGPDSPALSISDG